MVKVISVRSPDAWSHRDYGDRLSTRQPTMADGAAGGLHHPLHAETPVTPINPSPYSPSSRRFRSAVYLRVADTAEYALATDEVRVQVDALRPPTDPERTLRDPAWRAKLAALELLWPYARRDELDTFR